MRYFKIARTIFFCVVVFLITKKNVFAEEWVQTYKAYSSKDEYMLSDGSRISHYKNKGLWEDSLGNYGTQSCMGTIALNNEGKILEWMLFCQGKDFKNNQFTTRAYRDNDMDAGIGASTYIDGNGIFEDYIGAKCKYAVNYFEEALFAVNKCKK